ncbi:MAG: peroxide stress protein YaaA [Cryobacterium sp.]
MLVLIPPSETKRSGGGSACLDWTALSYRQLNTRRQALAQSLVQVCGDTDSAMAALKLGRTQAGEIERNRQLFTSAGMPAIDRYTGVLFDALDAETLSTVARSFAAESLVVHSALFGLLGALDPIPAYRLSHDSRLPDHALKPHWGPAITDVLAATSGLILDFRSQGYVALGRAPERPDSVFLHVVTLASDGRARALNHFNKTAKGRLARELMKHGEHFTAAADLLDWAATAGFDLRQSAPHTLTLVV